MKKALLIILRILVTLTMLAVASYVGMSFYMKNHFFEGTSVNGVDISLMTEVDARNAMALAASDYQLTIFDNLGVPGTVTGSLMGLHEGDYSRLGAILDRQNPLLWVQGLYRTFEYEDETIYTVDEEALYDAVRHLSIVTDSNGASSVDAYVDYNEETGKFAIIPEVYGDNVNADEIASMAKHSACLLEPVLDTRIAGGYGSPEVLSDDPALINERDLLNKYTSSVIWYDMGDALEKLNCDIYHDWLSIKNDRVVLDESKVAEYVAGMAEKYDTYGQERHLITSWGDDIILESDDFGWEIDREAEKAQIIEEIMGHRAVIRDFNYLHEGLSHGETDLGNSYVEVNMTKQHLYLYIDGEAILDSDIVTGNMARGHRTPPGIFTLDYKTRNRYLVGPDYRTFVNYWMPFNKNIGLHDATWRKSFGGEIYKTAGSHGCVNLPKSVAAEIYDRIDPGFLVICYYED